MYEGSNERREKKRKEREGDKVSGGRKEGLPARYGTGGLS